LNGREFDAEMHIVHLPPADMEDTLYAVLGIFFEELNCEGIEIYTTPAEPLLPVLIEDQTKEAVDKCLERRKPSDDFWAAMSITNALMGNEVSNYAIDEDINNVPVQEFLESMNMNNFWTY
jgi:hypothetical protein